jgi:hypothetical protein
MNAIMVSETLRKVMAYLKIAQGAEKSACPFPKWE